MKKKGGKVEKNDGKMAKKQDEDVPVVVYKKHQKKIRSVRPSKKDESLQSDRPNVKQFKLDVYRLLARSGQNNSGESGSNSAKHALAIALGAEPPKKQAVNYKQLQADLKLRRQQEKEQDILKKVSNVSLTKKKKGGRKRQMGGRKDEQNLSGFGSWRGGVLRLSKDDVHRIKTTKSLKLSQK